MANIRISRNKTERIVKKDTKQCPFFLPSAKIFLSMNKKNIALNVILADSDDARREKRCFAIGFYTKKGEFRYMPRAVRVGVKQHQRRFNYIGVQAVDHDFQPLGHPTPVFIYAIKIYKGNYEF